MKISPRLIALAAAGALAIAVPLIAIYPADAAAETLLSQGKPATASSVESATLDASKAVDGNTGTRWASAEGHDPEWIRVDLGASYSITRVALTWEAAYGKAYQIQTSPDASTWTTIYTTSTGNGATDDLTGLTGTGRYVRVYGTVRGTAYGYSLFEFQVYGTSGPAPSPTATATPSPAPTGGAVLLSQGKPATASSVESATLDASKAVDGNTGTRWASIEGHDPEWIQVDLGASYPIGRVALTWEAAYGKAYQIQTSPDAGTWTTIYSTSTGNGATDDLTGLSGTGRYVRVYGTTRGTAYGYSLFEFQVYGTSGPAPSPTATATATPSPTATATPSPTATPTPSPTPTGHVDLTDPHKKDIAMQLVSSAENSSLDWRAQYAYIEDIGDGRGYTAGIIGFCSGTGDMLDLVELYTARKPGNVLAKYLPALRSVNGTDSHAGLDPGYPADWARAAQDAAFQKAQDDERDRVYFNPAVAQAKADGLRALGQFIYYDAIVMHGDGGDPESFSSIRANALKKAKPPAQGGNETTYLNAFLDARRTAMLAEPAHSDTSRVDTEQRVFLQQGNLDLNPPLSWSVYGEPYYIAS